MSAIQQDLKRVARDLARRTAEGEDVLKWIVFGGAAPGSGKRFGYWHGGKDVMLTDELRAEIEGISGVRLVEVAPGSGENLVVLRFPQAHRQEVLRSLMDEVRSEMRIEAKLGDIFLRISPPGEYNRVGYSQTGTVVQVTDDRITLVVNVDMPRNMVFRRDNGMDCAGLGSFIVRPDVVARDAFAADKGLGEVAVALGMSAAALDPEKVIARVKDLVESAGTEPSKEVRR